RRSGAVSPRAVPCTRARPTARRGQYEARIDGTISRAGTCPATGMRGLDRAGERGVARRGCRLTSQIMAAADNCQDKLRTRCLTASERGPGFRLTDLGPGQAWGCGPAGGRVAD